MVSRWNKYLDKDSEDQEEEVYTDREQLNSHKRNIVEEQRCKNNFFHNPYFSLMVGICWAVFWACSLNLAEAAVTNPN